MPLPYRRGSERIIRYLTGRFQLGGVVPTNDGYFTGVPKEIFTNTSAFGNTAGVLTQLSGFTLVAPSLKNVGESVNIRFAGTFAANANAKQIIINFGPVAFSNFTQAQNGGSFVYDINAMRVSNVVLALAGYFQWGFATIATGFVNTAYATFGGQFAGVNNLDTMNNLINIQALGAALNDIIHNYTKIDLTRM